jgi:hypothetical protein
MKISHLQKGNTIIDLSKIWSKMLTWPLIIDLEKKKDPILGFRGCLEE